MTPTDVRALAARFDIRPTRTLGQNFMVDPNTIRRIVKLAGVSPGDRVLEFGAGLGSLSLGLAAAAEELVAVEIDKRVIPALREVVEGLPNVTVVQADALELQVSDVTRGRPHRMVSNLPYNVATPLVVRLLEQAPEIFELLIVVQREAGERLAAPPGSKTYGSVSVMAAYYCETRLMGRVPPTVFWPQPKVESVIVRMSRRPASVQVDPALLKAVVRAAFSQRRKTIRNALPAALEAPVEKVEMALSHIGIEPGARAESLALEQFAGIANELHLRGLLGPRSL